MYFFFCNAWDQTCNLLIYISISSCSPIILKLKLSQIWPVGALSCWFWSFSCPHYALSFSFWHSNIATQAHLGFFHCPSHEINHFAKKPGSFQWTVVFRNQLCLLLWGCHYSLALSMDLYLFFMYLYIYIEIDIKNHVFIVISLVLIQHCRFFIVFSPCISVTSPTSCQGRSGRRLCFRMCSYYSSTWPFCCLSWMCVFTRTPKPSSPACQTSGVFVVLSIPQHPLSGKPKLFSPTLNQRLTHIDSTQTSVLSYPSLSPFHLSGPLTELSYFICAKL